MFLGSAHMNTGMSIHIHIPTHSCTHIHYSHIQYQVRVAINDFIYAVQLS